MIGMLFMLLVSRLRFADFFEMGSGWILLSVILLIRPLASCFRHGAPVSIREKSLLSWVAPVAWWQRQWPLVCSALQTSLIQLAINTDRVLCHFGHLCHRFDSGHSADIVAKLLGLQRPAPNEWVLIGAHYFGRELAIQLAEHEDQKVILLDSNARNIALARRRRKPTTATA